MTSPVEIEDVRTALVLSNNDIGGLAKKGVQDGKINKWAKFKPYQASDLDLPTVEKRRTAGWDQFDNANIEAGLLYGVKGALGNMQASLSGIHAASFVYKGPNGATYTKSGVTKGECYRLTDWVNPEDPTHYGYRSDAKIDLMVTEFGWNGEVDNLIILDANPSFTVKIDFTPHTTEKRKEMLSIYDFLKKESDTSGSQLDPLTCYPCIYITNNEGTSWLHCLYPGNRTTATQITNTGEQEWKVSVPSTVATNNTSGTMSIVLVKPDSGTSIFPGMDINNWIQDNGGDAWAAYFCGVPEGCGIPVTFSTGGSYGATLANGTAVIFRSVTSTTIAFDVNYVFTKSYDGDVTVRVNATVEFVPSSGGNKNTVYLNGSKSYTSVSGQDSGFIPVERMSFSTNEMPLMPGTITVTATIDTVIGTSEKRGKSATGTYVYTT